MKICLHSTGKETKFLLAVEWASLVAQLVNNLPAMQETPVQLLGWEDPLEKILGLYFLQRIFPTPVQLLGWEDPLEKIQAQYSWASLAAQLIKKKIPLQYGRLGFNPWVGKIPWRSYPLQPLPCFILYFKAKLAGYPRYLSTSCFCISVPYDDAGEGNDNPL